MTLPNFIIAGVPRAGTTSLVSYLRQHPQIFMAQDEPRFFLQSTDPNDPEVYNGKVKAKTLAEYEAEFAGVTDEKAIGEKTPFYFYSPGAIRRIKAMLPDVRLIFSLRNPIERAYSTYWMAARMGKEMPPIEEFLGPDSDTLVGGRYYSFLCQWYQAFDPSQIKVIILDDLEQSPQVVFEDLCRFLEVDDTVVLADSTAKNASAQPTNRTLAKMVTTFKGSAAFNASRALIPQDVRTQLKRYLYKTYQKPPPVDRKLTARLRPLFEDDIRELEGLLGRDLTIWRTRP